MAVNSLDTTMRLMGMSSGLDTDSIIQQTLKLHQLKIDKQLRAKTTLQWKQEAFNTIKDDIKDFRLTFLSATSNLNMRSSSVYNTVVAEKTGKNADAVSIKTSINSVTGSFTIGQVKSLAKGASVATTGDASHSGNGFANSTKLEDMVFNDGSADGKRLEFDGDGNADIEINGTTITLNKDDTLEGMLKKVNGSGANVTMSYDRLSDQFKIESKTIGGAGSTLNISGDALEVMGLRNGDVEAGTLARVEINGQIVESGTNTFDYRGVNITLNRTTGENEEDTKVTLKRDASEAVKTIENFVNSYNTLIKKLEGMLKERKTGAEVSYQPLTDEEKAEMTEKQIEDWEKIAKKGLLYNDTGIQNMISSLRGALFDTVEAAGMRPSDIGLTTGSFYSGMGSQISLDKDKLTAALEADPQKVMSVFMQTSSSKDAKTKYNESGLLGRIDTILGNYLSSDGAQTRSIDSIEKSLKYTNETIDKLQAKMQKEEDLLYKKYAAMETALSKLQSQGSYFSSMLGA